MKLWGIALLLFLLSAAPSLASVVINEFVPDANPEWVEFYNASDSAEYLKSYYLDDDISFDSDDGNTGKKSLSDLNINSILYPYVETSSMLNNSGDYIVLFDPAGNLIDQYQYTFSPGDNISIGRNPNQSGGFSILSSTTKGSANSLPPSPTSTPTTAPTSAPTPIPPTSTPKPPTSTPKPPSTPKPSATAIPTSAPTKIPVTVTVTVTNPSVLGEAAEFFSDSSPTPVPIPSEPTTNNLQPTTNPPWPAIILISLGTAGLSVSAFLFFRSRG